MSLEQELALLQRIPAQIYTELLGRHFTQTVRTVNDAGCRLNELRGNRVGNGRNVGKIATKGRTSLYLDTANDLCRINQTGK